MYLSFENRVLFCTVGTPWYHVFKKTAFDCVMHLCCGTYVILTHKCVCWDGVLF